MPHSSWRLIPHCLLRGIPQWKRPATRALRVESVSGARRMYYCPCTIRLQSPLRPLAGSSSPAHHTAVSTSFGADRARLAEYFLKTQHARSLLFLMLMRVHHHLSHQQPCLPRPCAPKALSPPGTRTETGATEDQRSTSRWVYRLVRLAFFSASSFVFKTGFSDAFLASPAAAAIRSISPPSADSTSKETTPTRTRDRMEEQEGEAWFLTGKAARILEGVTLPSPHTARGITAKSTMDVDQQWKLFAAAFAATMQSSVELPSHVPLALFLREGIAGHTGSSCEGAATLLEDLPHHYVCQHHHLLTGALLSLAHVPYVQARMAAALQPVEWLRQTCVRLCSLSSDSTFPSSDPQEEDDQTNDVVQRWVTHLLEQPAKALPTPNLLQLLQRLVLHLHLCSTLEKASRGSSHSAQMQRVVLQRLLARLVLQETYVFQSTVTTSSSAVSGGKDVQWNSLTHTDDGARSHMLTATAPLMGRRRVRGLPALLRVAVRQVSALCAEVDEHRAQVVTRADSLAYSTVEKTLRQTREFLNSLVYELLGLLPALLEVPVKDSGRHPTPSATPATAALCVVQGLSESWRQTMPHIQAYGADSPMALWWLQSVPPLLHAFAAVVEQQLDRLTEATANRANAASENTNHSDHIRGVEEQLFRSVGQGAFTELLSAMGALARSLLSYDRQAHERHLHHKATLTQQQKQHLLLSTSHGDPSANDGKKDDQDESDSATAGEETTGSGLPPALRRTPPGKRSLFYQNGQSQMLHREGDPAGRRAATWKEEAAALHSEPNRHGGGEGDDGGDASTRSVSSPGASSRFRRRHREPQMVAMAGSAAERHMGPAPSGGPIASTAFVPPALSEETAEEFAARTPPRHLFHYPASLGVTDGLLFRLFGRPSDSTITTLVRQFALDVQYRESALEDVWLGITLGLHRLSHTLRHHSPLTSSRKEQEPSRTLEGSETVEALFLRALRVECLDMAFAAFPLPLFESGQRLGQSLSSVLLTIEERGAAEETSRSRGGASSSSSSASHSLRATPSRRRECRRHHAFLQYVLQVGAEFLFQQTTRAAHLLQTSALRLHASVENVPPLSPVLSSTVSVSFALLVMRDLQWASVTHDFLSRVGFHNNHPSVEGGEGKGGPITHSSGLPSSSTRPTAVMEDNSNPEELEIQILMRAARDTLQCFASLRSRGTDRILCASPMTKSALLCLFLVQVKKTTVAINRLSRRRNLHNADATATPKHANDVKECASLFERVLQFLTQDTELLLLCGASPAFLDELCEVHLRLGLDREILLNFGDQVLLPTLLPLLLQGLEASAQQSQRRAALLQPTSSSWCSARSSTTQEEEEVVVSTALEHGEDCEAAVFLLSELCRFALAPEKVSSVLRHRWNDVLLQLSVYCLHYSYRGGLKRGRRGTHSSGIVLPTLLSSNEDSTPSKRRPSATSSEGIPFPTPDTEKVHHTLCRLFGLPLQSPSTAGVGLAARTLLRVCELNNGLFQHSRLEQLVGQGWSISETSAREPPHPPPSASAGGEGDGGETWPSVAASAALRAYETASWDVSFADVRAALRRPPTEVPVSDDAESLDRVCRHQDALRLCWAAAGSARRAAAQQRPFFAAKPFRAYVLGYLVRFMEYYLRETEHRLSSTFSSGGSVSTTAAGPVSRSSSSSTERGMDGVSDAMRASLESTPEILLDFIGYLTAGGSWAMVYWTLNAADIALRITQKQRGPSSQEQSQGGPSAIKEVLATAVLAQLRVIPPPYLASGVPMTVSAHSFAGSIFSSLVSVVLPTNFPKCWSALSDLLGDTSETLLRFPRRCKLYGLLPAPTANESRAVVFAFRQAMLHLESASVPFHVAEKVTAALLAKERQQAEKQRSRSDGAEENEEVAVESPEELEMRLEERAKALERDRACFYFSAEAVEAAAASAVKKKSTARASDAPKRYHRENLLRTAPSAQDFRKLLVSVICHLDATVQWFVQQTHYRNVVDAKSRHVMSRSLHCTVEECLVLVFDGFMAYVEQHNGASDLPARVQEDQTLLLWCGLCAVAMLAKGVKALQPKEDAELYRAMKSSVDHLVQSLNKLLATSPVVDSRPTALLEMVHKGMSLLVQDSSISRRCLLRMGIDSFSGLSMEANGEENTDGENSTTATKNQSKSPQKNTRKKENKSAEASATSSRPFTSRRVAGVVVVDLLTVMTGLWAVFQSGVVYAPVAALLHRLWLPLHSFPPLASSDKSSTLLLVTSKVKLEEVLSRFTALGAVKALPEESAIATADLTSVKPKKQKVRPAEPQDGTSKEAVNWSCQVQSWLEAVREISPGEAAALSSPGRGGGGGGLSAVKEEWSLSPEEHARELLDEHAGQESGGLASSPTLHSLPPPLALRACHENHLYLDLSKLKETAELVSTGEEDEAEEVSGGEGVCTTDHVDHVDLQGRQLQQHYGSLQPPQPVEWWSTADGGDQEGTNTREKMREALAEYYRPARLFLSNVLLLVGHVPLVTLLVDEVPRRPLLGSSAPGAAMGQPRRLIASLVTLHNKLYRGSSLMSPHGSVGSSHNSAMPEVAALLDQVWRALEFQWQRQLLAPQQAALDEALRVLMQDVKVFRLSSWHSGRASESSSRSSSPDGARGVELSSGGRKRWRDMFALEMKDVDSSLQTKKSTKLQPVLLTAAAFRLTSGLISSESSDAPRHDDIRSVVVSQALKEHRASSASNNKGEEVQVSRRALARCMCPVQLSKSVQKTGNNDPSEIPLLVLAQLLKSLSRTVRGSFFPDIGAFAHSVSAYVTQRYVLLRPRLDGNSLNITYALWGEEGGPGTSPDVQAAREALYRLYQLPSPPQQVGVNLSSSSRLFPARLCQSLETMCRVQCPTVSTEKSPQNSSSGTEVWVYDTLRDAAAYLHCLTSLVVVLCHFRLFGPTEEVTRATGLSGPVHVTTDTDHLLYGAADPNEKNSDLTDHLSAREAQISPEHMKQRLLEQVLLHWLNVSGNLLRHGDTLCHLSLDLGGHDLQQRASKKDNEEGDTRSLLQARQLYVDSVQHLVCSTVQESLLLVATLAEQHAKDVPIFTPVLHNLMVGCPSESLLPMLERNISEAGPRTPDAGAGGKQPSTFAATTSCPALQYLAWMRKDHVWAAKAPYAVTGSPCMLSMLSSPAYVLQLTPHMRALTTPSMANALASALTLYTAQPDAQLPALLSCVTAMLSASSYPSWAVRFTSVRLLCQAVVQELLTRDAFRQALGTHTLSILAQGQAGSVPNETLIAFLAVVARADLQVPSQPLASLLHLVMGLRPDVFGQPPVPTRHGRMSLFQVSDVVQGIAQSQSPHHSGKQRTEEKEDPLLRSFTAESADATTSSHAETLAHLHLSFPSTMELGMHLEAMRRLSGEEHRQALAAIKAADDARRERVAAVLFPATSGGVAITAPQSSTAALRLAAQKTGSSSSNALVIAARLEMESHLQKHDWSGRLGVALLHLRFALRKVLHWSLRQVVSQLGTQQLAEASEVLAAVENIEGPRTAASSAHTAALSTSSQSNPGSAPASRGPHDSSMKRAWWQQQQTQSADSMTRGTLRLLLQRATACAETLSQEVVSSDSTTDRGGADARELLVLTPASRRRVAHILYTLRRRRGYERQQNKPQHQRFSSRFSPASTRRNRI